MMLGRRLDPQGRRWPALCETVSQTSYGDGYESF